MGRKAVLAAQVGTLTVDWTNCYPRICRLNIAAIWLAIGLRYRSAFNVHVHLLKRDVLLRVFFCAKKRTEHENHVCDFLSIQN